VSTPCRKNHIRRSIAHNLNVIGSNPIPNLNLLPIASISLWRLAHTAETLRERAATLIYPSDRRSKSWLYLPDSNLRDAECDFVRQGKDWPSRSCRGSSADKMSGCHGMAAHGAKRPFKRKQRRVTDKVWHKMESVWPISGSDIATKGPRAPAKAGR